MSFLSIGRKGGNRKKKEKDGGAGEDRDRVAGGKREKRGRNFFYRLLLKRLLLENTFPVEQPLPAADEPDLPAKPIWNRCND